MRQFVPLFTMVVVACLIGFGLTYFSLVEGGLYGTYQHGVWQARPDVGSPSPDPYTRAYLARNEALQLGRGEGIRFVAVHDESGETLTLDCSYRLFGQTPVAAFWTLRAVDKQGRTIAGELGPSSMHSRRLARDNDGNIDIHIGPELAPMNWLQTTGSGDFQLILTFYDASFFAGLGTNVTEMPALTRKECA